MSFGFDDYVHSDFIPRIGRLPRHAVLLLSYATTKGAVTVQLSSWKLQSYCVLSLYG